MSDPVNGKNTVRLNVYVESKLVFSTEFDAKIEIGRQQNADEKAFSQFDQRVVVAGVAESEISRKHVVVEGLQGQKIRIQNASAINSIVYGTADLIAPETTRELDLPAILMLGNRVLEFESVKSPEDGPTIMDSLPHRPTPPGKNDAQTESSIQNILLGRTETETTFLLKGLHRASGVFRSAASEEEFYESASSGIVEVAALETGVVMLWDDSRWKVACFRSQAGDTEPHETWNPSYTVLENVRKSKRTFWQIPRTGADAPSLFDVKALVAAPLMDEEGNVFGALYGDRRQRLDGKMNSGLTEVEAILVEVMASGVASGVQRLRYQQEAVQARVLFEQFFTPELSRELEDSPDLLVGKDVEVSLLFCEIRGFSEFSEQLGTRLTLDWVNDVMGTLSSCMSASEGTLVDMMGDEIIGMWGAPKERRDHADLACKAAVQMFEELPGLNRRWQQVLEKPMDIGIGVHSGVARVGNIGSERKFKYGPLGTSVRVAIQAQRSTQEFGAKILITSDTKDRLTESFSIRQLGQLVDKQTDNRFQMFEIMPTPPKDWDELKRRYETAVDAFHKQDYPTAIRLVGKVLADHPGDRPSLQLMSRINEALTPKPWSL